MRFPSPLVPARLIRRYKRFLADAELDDGRTITAHCANPGAMTGFDSPGMRIWLEPNDDPKKKLRFGWRLAELPDGHFAGIDTSVPNRVVAEALRDGQIPELTAYPEIKPEVRFGTASRVDFLLTAPDGHQTYLEVKNVHLSRQPGIAAFPDTPTARGAKHLQELTKVAAQGHRAVLLYLVQRTDCTAMTLAADVDPLYAQLSEQARHAGVEILCYDTKITHDGVWLNKRRPFNP